jgi:hypothetical protein
MAGGRRGIAVQIPAPFCEMPPIPSRPFSFCASRAAYTRGRGLPYLFPMSFLNPFACLLMYPFFGCLHGIRDVDMLEPLAFNVER